MTEAERYPYRARDTERGQAFARPILPFQLSHSGRQIDINALLDTGATVNVLPFEIGQALGLQWNQQTRSVVLTGNLAHYEARGVLLSCHIGQFTPVELVFAWTQAQEIPPLLGQVNFFAEFDVCFFHSRQVFELKPKES